MKGCDYMQLRRSRSVVDWFKVQKIGNMNEETPETTLKTDMVLLGKEDKNDQLVSTVGVQLEFFLVHTRFIVSGKISQINYILEKEIQSEMDFSEEEVHELLAPIFETIQRLTYDVTEIILDEPGIHLDFSPTEKALREEVEK